jgi:hypothetical protein
MHYEFSLVRWCADAGFGERGPLVAKVGNDLQWPAKGVDVGGDCQGDCMIAIGKTLPLWASSCRGRPSVLGWLKFGLIFESNATASLVLVVHETFPPAVSPSLPFQQESVYPCPVRQDPAWLRFRRDVLGKAVEAFSEPSGHGN